MSEALAIDVVRDPGTEIGATLDRFAGAFSARFSRFGAATPRHTPSLLSRIESRWSPGALTAGLIEVYDGADFGSLVREWTVAAGYEGEEYRSEIPFVIPVDTADPTADAGGVRAARRPDPRAALRPVAVRQAPATSPRPREQWRPAAARTLSPYPAALGNAGAVQAHLLRFPEARAQVATTTRRALVEDAPGSLAHPWDAPGAAAREDGRLADTLEARFNGPAPVVPIAAWLVPQSAAAEQGPLAERPRAVAGRWSNPQTGPALALGAQLLGARFDTPPDAEPGIGAPGALAARLSAPRDPRAMALPEVETTWVAPGDNAAKPQQISASRPQAAGSPADASAVARAAAVPPRAFVPRLILAAAQEAQPWGGRAEATPPFVPGGLARVALALGQAFDAADRAPSGWSALADGRTLVLPTAVREVAPARSGAGRAPGRATEVQARAQDRVTDRVTDRAPDRVTDRAQPQRPGTTPAQLHAERIAARVPAAARPATAEPGIGATARIASEIGTPSGALGALARGLGLLIAAPPGHQPGPVAADLPAFARPFASAAALPETHREAAPALTTGAVSLGERMAAFAARAEVSLGLTVASSPAGSLDAPWFAQDVGTLLVPLPAPQSQAAASQAASQAPVAAGRLVEGRSDTSSLEAAAPTRREAQPMGRLLSLPALTIAVQARAERAALQAETSLGERRSAKALPAAEAAPPEVPLRDGAVLPLRAGPLDATYVVPTRAPLAAPAMTAGAERMARFAQQVAQAHAPAPAASASEAAPSTPAPLHPALAPFTTRPAASPPPTLGERLAQAALVAFQAPAREADPTARSFELESPRELVVPAEAPDAAPSRMAARAEVEAARIQARAEAVRAQAVRTEARQAEMRTEAARAEAARAEVMRTELTRVEAARAEARAQVTRAEAARAEIARTEAGRAEAVRAEARVEAARIEAARAEARVEAVLAEARRLALATPESGLVSQTSAAPGATLAAIQAALQAADPSSAATTLVLQRAAGRTLDISAPAARAEHFVRWLTGELAGQPALEARLEAAGILAPGARIQPTWLATLAQAGATADDTTTAAEARAGRPPAERFGDAPTELVRAAALARAPEVSRERPAAEPSRLGITAWPATVQRLLEVWRIAEATLDAPTAGFASEFRDMAAGEAGRDELSAGRSLARIVGRADSAGAASWPEAVEGALVLPAPAAAAQATDARRARALPGTTALAAAGLGTRLATRRFDELLAAAPGARAMISPSAGGPAVSARPSAAASTRDVLVRAGMASAPDADFEVISSTSGYSMADLAATSAVWPALVAPAVGADAALGASEEWAGSAAPGGRLAAPLNFERALLTWSAAAVRDADSRAVEQRSGQAMGPLGQLVRQNAVVMGPRSADVAMRASTGGSLFGDRGPAGLVAPDVHAKRVMVDPGARAAEQALRSTPGERPTRDVETSEEAQHRLADQVGEEISPEETERLAREIISRLKRELEFDAARLGDDAWD